MYLERSGKKRKPFLVICNFLKDKFKRMRERKKPAVVHYYSENMGFVDQVGRCYLSMWQRRAFRSWKLKLVHFFVFIAAENAWRWFAQISRNRLKFKDFISFLIEGILGVPKMAEIRTTLTAVRLEPDFGCKVVNSNTWRLCSVCHRSCSKLRCDCSGEAVHLKCRDEHHRRRRLNAAERIVGDRRSDRFMQVLGWVRNLLGIFIRILGLLHQLIQLNMLR